MNAFVDNILLVPVRFNSFRGKMLWFFHSHTRSQWECVKLLMRNPEFKEFVLVDKYKDPFSIVYSKNTVPMYLYWIDMDNDVHVTVIYPGNGKIIKL